MAALPAALAGLSPISALLLLLQTGTAVLAVALAARLARYLRAVSLLRSLPTPKASSALGHLEAVTSPQHHRVLLDWADQLGGIYWIRLAWTNAVIVTDPLIVAEVLGRATEVEKSIASVYSHFNVLLHAQCKPTIFTSPTDDYWKMVRRGVSGAFNPRNLRKRFGEVVDVNQRLIGHLLAAGPGTALDLDNAAQRITLDVIGRVGFGKDFGATAGLDGANANHAFHTMEAARDEGVRRWNFPLRAYLTFLPGVRRGGRAFRDFQAIMWDLLAELKARGEPAPDDTTIAAHTLRIRDSITDAPLPDDRLTAELGTFFTGGFETTGHTISWALYLICTHPEVEAKCLAEMDSLGLLASAARPTPRAPDFDDLAKLAYLGLAIKEAMRMLPVLGDGTNRTTQRDTLLGGHLIPAGTMVWLPFSAMFNSRHNWDQPEVYMPERWMEPNAEYARPAAAASAGANAGGAKLAGAAPTVQVQAGAGALPAAPGADEDGAARPAAGAGKAKRFMPFSEGRRDCVGQSLARMNYTASVAMLLGRFHFELAPGMGGPAGVRARESVALLTLQPEGGLHVFCQPRT